MYTTFIYLLSIAFQEIVKNKYILVSLINYYNILFEVLIYLYLIVFKIK